MILVSRLGKNQKEIVINADLIEIIEEIPDTVITLVNGKKFIVNDKKEDVIKKIIKYKRSILLV